MDYKSLSTAVFVGFVIVLTLYVIFNNKKIHKRPTIEGFKNYVEPFANANSFDAVTIKLLVTDVFKDVYGRDITNDEAVYYGKFFEGASGGTGSTPQERKEALDSLRIYITQVMLADKAAGRDVSKVSPGPNAIPISESTDQQNMIDGNCVGTW